MQNTRKSLKGAAQVATNRSTQANEGYRLSALQVLKRRRDEEKSIEESSHLIPPKQDLPPPRRRMRILPEAKAAVKKEEDREKAAVEERFELCKALYRACYPKGELLDQHWDHPEQDDFKFPIICEMLEDLEAEYDTAGKVQFHGELLAGTFEFDDSFSGPSQEECSMSEWDYWDSIDIAEDCRTTMKLQTA
ncbi:hypothetical protein BJ508DRAFT_377191 [Ascobolus immersus RN42]|uniref:Uncharacterized protein n=1 Tax=Ascobolus immersus RN42 TaxID=1160509 RepID=A0A3N4IEQ0_ASCIM|nr:hypothetical protein BJ508DRAFT_377191 [Ascobolus immersus RN42]